MEREVNIYFFHLPLNIERDVDSWKWMTYTPPRDYVTFPGIFEGRKFRVVNQSVGGPTPESECTKDTDCIGIVKTVNDTSAVLVDFLDLNVFRRSAEAMTLVKIRDISGKRSIIGASAWESIDACCPKHKQTNREEIMQRVNDTMTRISCDISPEKFLNEYVRKREAVILVNCTKDWVAQNQWTFEKLLSEKDGKLRWRSKFESKLRHHKKFKNNDVLSGNLLKSIVKNNGTIRVFDKLGRRTHTACRKNGATLNTDKMHLFSEYRKPRPVPVDYYEKSGIFTDFQWLILSQKDTGDARFIAKLSPSCS